MAKWYDTGQNTPQQNGQWVTQPDGTAIWVAGTNATGHNGQGTPAITGQGGRWVTGPDGTAFWQADTSAAGNYKGQGTASTGGHWQTSADGTTAQWVPDAAPPGNTSPTAHAGDAAPAPVPDWRTQQSWWGSLFPTGVTERAAYDLDPSMAWATATNKLGGNNWAPEYGWLANQQGRMHTIYGDENIRAQGTPEGEMTFSDWIEKNAPRFHQDFIMQPPSQKGYSNAWQPSGRNTPFGG